MRRHVPELFLGLLALAVAAVLVAHVVSGTIRDVKPRHDTITVTGSARRPISADLVQWSVTVSRVDATPARAASQLESDLTVTRSFLVSAGIPAKAIGPSVVSTEPIVERLSKTRVRRTYRVSQRLDIQTRKLDVVQSVATRLGHLIEQGIDVSTDQPAWISTNLARAKLETLASATANAKERAEILVKGLGGHLGRMRSSSLGVYQVTPRFSTDISDYGVNDTSSRDKDVNAVVSATFDVED